MVKAAFFVGLACSSKPIWLRFLVIELIWRGTTVLLELLIVMVIHVVKLKGPLSDCSALSVPWLDS